MNDTIHQERVYESRHIADLLEIGDSTLRKWCLALERQGYQFTRDTKDNRLFTDHDIISLRTLKEMIKGRKMTIENASCAIVLQFVGVNVASTVPALPEEKERVNERYDELIDRMSKSEEKMDQLIELNKTLLERLESQDKSIRERDEILLQMINELKEAKEQLTLAAVQLEEEEKKKPWWKLW